MRFVPTWFHGILDYVAGLVAIFSPEIFGFSDAGGSAATIARIVGIVLIAYSLFTDYGPSTIRAMPMAAHLTIDFIAGMFLAMSPWFFGFSTQPDNVWMPHLFMGIAMMIMVLVSESVSASYRHSHA